MAEFTIGDKILIHLYAYKSINLNDYYNIPWEVTQDGISNAMRISRAHTSLELKKLKDKRLLDEEKVRVLGGRVSRFAYCLNESGVKTALDVMERAERNGVDLKSLMELKKQDPGKVLQDMSDEDSLALGVACAFRISVPLDILPSHSKSVIPADSSRNTAVTDDLRDRLFSAATDEEKAAWHSYVADYYDKMENKSAIPDEDTRRIERTYHLLKAGRYISAAKIIGNYLYDIIRSDDKGLFEALKEVPLDQIREKNRLDILIALAETALSQNDLKTARETSEKLIEMDGGQEYGYACLIECLHLRKMPKDAEEMEKRVQISGNALGLLKLADVFLDLEQPEKASKYFDEGAKLISENNIAAVCQKFMVQTRIDVINGNMEEAQRHLSKAFSSTDTAGKRNVKALGKGLGLDVSGLRIADSS